MKIFKNIKNHFADKDTDYRQSYGTRPEFEKLIGSAGEGINNELNPDLAKLQFAPRATVSTRKLDRQLNKDISKDAQN